MTEVVMLLLSAAIIPPNTAPTAAPLSFPVAPFPNKLPSNIPVNTSPPVAPLLVVLP
jgi:hypothetical protein